MPSRWNRTPRDNKGDGTNSRAAWFQRGYHIPADDPEISHGDVGLGYRERKALAEENNNAWGLNWAQEAIARRGAQGGHISSRLKQLKRIITMDEARVKRRRFDK